ncbi:hypothetical protein SRABI118_02652 [Massilia sp. Bi118]|uniref:PEP-CTERM sorting domain-containing protein n=1 Tax=Massilia sp. Bi118 TaxID=2822346 RepID=UPI001D3BE2A5|nr:PEP-CTERM sorting domain-containing protein [Massilia sp. Bi118]CAH0238458.1 hypothetical protein SRABI118_02652 [Massilia sp. Bi118]
MKSFITSLALAASLTALALPASADIVWTDVPVTDKGALGQTWTGVWDQDNSWNVAEYVSDVSVTGNTLSYKYLGAGFWMGTPTQTYVFKTTAATAGSLTLGIDLITNTAWDGSAANLYIWQGSTATRTLLASDTDGKVEHKTFALELEAGQDWGFLAVSGSIGDDLHFTGPVWGSITITDPATPSDVPEPASLALLGLGVLGAAAARRRKG